MNDYSANSAQSFEDDSIPELAPVGITRLRPYQEFAHADVLDYLLTGHQRVALISATGSGKTTIVLSLLARLKALAESSRGPFTGAVVVAPQKQIVDGFKSTKDFEFRGDRKVENIPSVVSGRAVCRPVLGNQSASISKHLKATRPQQNFALVTAHHTLARLKTKGLPRSLVGKLLVVDEGHHVSTEKEVNSISDVVRLWVARGGYVVIVTATPFRHDGKSVLSDDGWVTHHRTIATHAADVDPDTGLPYVPQDLRIEHEQLKGYVAKRYKELTGESGARVTGDAEAQIVRRWIKDGRPKLAILVPSEGSRAWTARMMTAFKKAGARPFDAVGTDSKTKQRTRWMLAREQKVTRWEDSQVDVVIACRRFDEGTDWPLCSHIYVVGFPSNLPLSIQRWGRTFRSKTGIAGHKHPDVACITFFVPRWNESVAADLERSKATQRHRDAAILLACHLQDYKTGGKYAANASLFDHIRAPRKSGLRSLDRQMERISNAVEMDAAQRSRAGVDLRQIKAKVGTDSTKVHHEILSKLDLWGQGRVFNALLCWYENGLNHAKLDPLVKQRLVDDLVRAARRCRVELPKTSSGNVSPDKEIIRKHLREAFDRAVADFAHLTFNGMDDDVLRTVSGWTGETVAQVCGRLKNEATRHGGHDLSKIKAGILGFFEANGKPPCRIFGDAEEYVGYATNWNAVEQWLYPQGTSLLKLAKEMGVEGRRAEHDLTRIKRGILVFFKTHQKRPSDGSGDATKYVGYKTTWMNIARWLVKKGTSLRQTSHDVGVGEVPIKHELKKIKKGILLFFKEHGCRPAITSGGAVKYVGYETTWSAIASWTRLQGVSLAVLCEEMGVEGRRAEHDLTRIRRGILVFFKTHQKRPSDGSGDATKYVGYKTTWMAVSLWARKQGTSLPLLCEEQRMHPFHAKHDIEKVRVGVTLFVRNYGRTPNSKSGSATRFLGYPSGWSSVDKWLKREGSSLANLCTQMGFMPFQRADHSLKKIKAGISAYFKEHKKLPTQVSGDATKYVGYSTKWGNIDSWLWKQGSSVSKLCGEMGFRR